MSDFGRTTAADEVLKAIDLTGKTVMITGGASGLGQETARAMAARHADVVIAARDATKLATAAEAISEGADGRGSVETLMVDLASLDSVRNATAEARKRFDKIDILINNAGVMACPRGTTTDGFETQFGTNHLGHFVFTSGLMPLLEKGDDKRIVNLSSRGHHGSKMRFDDPNYENRDYDKWEAYGQSKTANILFSVGLQKRLADRGFDAFAVHPGGIQTNLGRHMTEEDMAWIRGRMEEQARESGEESSGFKSIPQGAATTCWAATAPELTGHGGVYAEDCKIAELSPSGNSGVRPYAVDATNAERLWTLSEDLTGETFPS